MKQKKNEENIKDYYNYEEKEEAPKKGRIFGDPIVSVDF